MTIGHIILSMTVMNLCTKARNDTDVAYTKTPWLQRINWEDGTPAYCRGCDGTVPLTVTLDQLVCPEGHHQHPVNVLLNRSDA